MAGAGNFVDNVKETFGKATDKFMAGAKDGSIPKLIGMFLGGMAFFKLSGGFGELGGGVLPVVAIGALFGVWGGTVANEYIGKIGNKLASNDDQQRSPEVLLGQTRQREATAGSSLPKIDFKLLEIPENSRDLPPASDATHNEPPVSVVKDSRGVAVRGLRE